MEADDAHATTWVLELPIWLIQDGHDEVARGTVVTESVEFQVAVWSFSDKAVPCHEHLGGNRYRIRGPLLAAPDPYILDVGGLVIGSLGWPPTSGLAAPRTGDVIEAIVELQLDSFGLQNYVGPRYGTSRRWLVERIEWRPSDQADEATRSVDRTEGRSGLKKGTYILTCRDLDVDGG